MVTLETPLPLAEGKHNELIPRPLPLSTEAQEGWKAFADHVEQQIGPGGDMEPIRGLANKLPEHAARLAAVLALVDDLNAPAVSTKYLRYGIQLAEHYAAEALRLFNAGRMDPELLLAQKTLTWLSSKWPYDHVGLSDLYRRGPNPIRDSKTARKVLVILADHGWLVAADGGAEIDGAIRREAWRVVRT